MNINERIAAVPGIAQILSNKPFPAQPAVPNDDFSWESWQLFYADAPGRLIHLISADYHDCEADEFLEEDKDCDTLFEEYEDSYTNYYQQCLTATTTLWGTGNMLTKHDTDYVFFRLGKPSRPDLETHTPAKVLNGEEMLFSTWRFELCWWQLEDRIAFVHYIGDKGDGDFRFAVSIGMFKNEQP